MTAQTSKMRRRLRQSLLGPHVLAFLPALALAAFWLGGETLLLGVALGIPLLFALSGGFAFGASDGGLTRQLDLTDSHGLIELADLALARARLAQMSTACFLIEADGIAALERRHGEVAARGARDLLLGRLRSLLRDGDTAIRTGDIRYAVLLAPNLRLDLESLLQIANRLQATLEEPTIFDGITQYISVSVGFCGSPRLPHNAMGEQLVDAATTALAEALANGPSAVRAWSDSMRTARTARQSLRNEVARALENGQIQPWYQPQLCTSTGRVSGVEALARWIHPDRGVIAPAQFFRALEDNGRMDRLGEIILNHTLSALRSWDKAGVEIPRVGVNFSMNELRNPKLVDRIKWELDRFDLTPDRLGIEVLETVIAETDDGIVVRNIAGLSKLGCQVDLDDFGTGHASITSLRRFAIARLKIDRSFVSQVDRDEEQRRMIAAILGMADRLGLETLAEGVESLGEHALLSQLGCDHVQGFGIARPMPKDQLAEWVTDHNLRIAETPTLGRNTI
ncbi:GGDEF domain-containing phosphodiesterase [Puniceibacterium sp. IMCC21224]|uniref:GGDEF domain-containing phosphodiesterase n=1 Tax=Puniceibacterium sp. IMCC21224 TaxID=1618204 RepID=UPI0012E045F4|nr:GGDEF domain-containing phosphodiesterase [Puniceibacterium sp. IMCC21224]